MTIQNQNIDLNLTPSGVLPVVHLKQYDTQSRTITCKVYDGTSAFSAPPGSTATIRGTKPDNTGFEYAATISGSTVTFTVQDQMTVLSGDIPSEIRIIFGYQVIGTISIVLRVEPSALKSDVTVSKTDLPLIAEAAKNIVDAKKYMESASASASSAASSASSASASEKSASDSAASASASATTAAGYAGAAQYSLGVDPDTGLFGVFKNS